MIECLDLRSEMNGFYSHHDYNEEKGVAILCAGIQLSQNDNDFLFIVADV